MIKNVVIMGSTGSIGTSSLKVLKNNKKFKIYLLTTKSNVQKIYNQAIKFKVKISSKKIYDQRKPKQGIK